ncbi:hypothetical protein [Metallibacterium sp.]|uniref:hypothetical protein n=1 Tax=Metallibacterium sp. TaxID=2940281 RepID=UPI002634B422|nr:hypothetical protein [Metallibacterium sp.]
MTSRPPGLFDQEIRQRKLQALGDPLVALHTIVPWSIFRKTLNRCTMKGVIRAKVAGSRLLGLLFGLLPPTYLCSGWRALPATRLPVGIDNTVNCVHTVNHVHINTPKWKRTL